MTDDRYISLMIKATALAALAATIVCLTALVVKAVFP